MRSTLHVSIRFLLAWLFSLSLLVYADSTLQNPPLRHAISLYGEPKYPADFTHFNYANPDAPKGGRIKQGVIGHFDSLTPYIDRGTAVAGSYLMYDSLLARSWDEPLTKYGLIAEKMQLDPDNRWARFYINPLATFHDGKAVTAEDVKFSFDVLREKGSTFYKQFYQDIEHVDINDVRTVTFHFKNSENRELPLILGQMPIFPKHYWQHRDFSSPGLDVPVTSGPYKAVTVEPGRSVTFQRVENYWGKGLAVNRGRHNFDVIQYEYYRNNAVLLEALQKGEYDFRIVVDPREWHDKLNDQRMVKSNLTRSSLTNHNPQTLTLTYNSRKPILSDAPVRQALGYTVDFNWINKQLFHGMYQRAHSIFDGSDLGADAAPTTDEINLLKPWPKEVPAEALTSVWRSPGSEADLSRRERKRKVLALLNQAGWTVQNHRMTNAKGQHLELEVLVSSPDNERILLPVQKLMQDMGITLKIRTVDIAQYIERLRNQDYDLVLHTFPHTASPGTEQISHWGSSTVDHHGSRNLAGVDLKSVDALTEKIPMAKSREELLTLVRTLDRTILWNHYVLPLWYLPDWLVIHKKSLRYPTNPAPYTLDLSTWWYER
ncbi:extracellular solute-binding protein [uncultured Endozoicomonas sp.]|uniref:extracellular solute-binding protein n=1 Tax=uncultured Endozoicomonas sp. TaxID=432652 RepID=UPI002620550D|nr:extracellular solute-binding protein [uncultured Endozoicomonas sp.]